MKKKSVVLYLLASLILSVYFLFSGANQCFKSGMDFAVLTAITMYICGFAGTILSAASLFNFVLKKNSSK